MPLKPVDQNIKVILGPCIDDTDFKTREELLTYNQAGMEIDVILEKHDGTIVTTAIVPTTAGDYDWAHTDQGYYEFELPASGGISFNNTEEGSLRVVGYCTGVLPFSSVTYDIVPEKVWNSLIEGSDNLEVDLTHIMGTILTEGGAGRLAAAFIKLLDVVTPVLVASDVMRGTNSAALASVCTETRLAELAAANLPTDIADIPTVAEFNARTLLAASYALEATLAAMKGATFVEATDSLEAIRDRGDAAWVTGAGGSDRLLMIDTTIATLASQTSFTLTAGSVDNDAYNNCTIVIEDAAIATQKAIGLISGYIGGTKTITLKYDPAIFTMAVGDKIYVLAENALKSTLVNRQLNVAVDGDIAGNVDGSAASVTGAVGSVTGAVGSVTADVGITQTGADKVWSTAARTLTSFGTLVADIWNRATSLLTTVGSIGKLLVDNVNATLSSRSSHGAADVWTAGSRELSTPNNYKADVSALALEATLGTANTHLTDIKGTGFVKDTHSQPQCLTATGFNTVVPDAAGIAAGLHTTTDGKVDAVQTDATAIKAKTDNLPSGIAKNVALPFFDFYMLLADGLTAATGKTVTGQIRKDNGAFAGITNIISEIGSGLYAIASGFTQVEMNADKVTLKFTAIGCKDTIIVIYPT